MYARSIVEARLEIAAKRFGFRPEYHTPAEVDDFDARLRARHADAYAVAKMAAQVGDPNRASKVEQQTLIRLIANAGRLNSDEARFIRNERALMMADAEYFLTRFYRILNTEGRYQHFSFLPRPAQQIFFACVALMEEMGIAIEILIAKARQLGLSTVVEGLMLQMVLYNPGANAVAASADESKTREMARKLTGAYDLLPWWGRPIYTRRVESNQGFLYLPGGGGVTFQHGEQSSPIAMGSTVVGYHLSEVSSYTNADQMIEVGLWKAVHPHPSVRGFLESTCKSDTGWWATTYWDAKKLWPLHRYRVMALFLPFYTAIGMYPNPTEELAHPIPRGWRPAPETRQMMRESAGYVQSNDILAKAMMQDGKQWEMSRKQAWWWEWNFMAARSKGAEKGHYAEYPHTDKVAFQSSYDNVFGKDVIAEADSQRITKYHVYQIVGQSIEDRHEPDQEAVDGSCEVVQVSYVNRRGTKYSWELIPVSWVEPFEELDDLRDEDSHMGKLFIYLEPEIGYDYSIGVRTSVGISSDPTVIAVSRRGCHEQEPDVQAAEFRDIEVSHVEAYAWAMAIAAYYARYMKPEFGQTRYREPYVAIEQMTSVGDTTQLQMRKMGYARFHHMIRYDSKPQEMRKSKAHKIGWYSSGWSTPLINDGFVTYVKNGWYQVNSSYTLYEMDHWEVHLKGEDGKVKFEAGEDSTAYGLSANALAAFCPNDLRSLAERTLKRRMDIGGKPSRPMLDLTPTAIGHTTPLSEILPSRRVARVLTLRR